MEEENLGNVKNGGIKNKEGRKKVEGEFVYYIYVTSFENRVL